MFIAHFIVTHVKDDLTARIRQSLRMAEFALRSTGDYVICDFVAPLPEMRNNFKADWADWVVWMDTIDQGRFEDTNKAFVPPQVYDFRVSEFDAPNGLSSLVVTSLMSNADRCSTGRKKLFKC